jgi:hypothetical protein
LPIPLQNRGVRDSFVDREERTVAIDFLRSRERLAPRQRRLQSIWHKTEFAVGIVRRLLFGGNGRRLAATNANPFRIALARSRAAVRAPPSALSRARPALRSNP